MKNCQTVYVTKRGVPAPQFVFTVLYGSLSTSSLPEPHCNKPYHHQQSNFMVNKALVYAIMKTFGAKRAKALCVFCVCTVHG